MRIEKAGAQMRGRRALLLCHVVMWCSMVWSGALLAAREQEIFGWVEWAHLYDADFRLKAKLDTGAATSSLDATDIQAFKRGGKSWVRFTVTDPDSERTRQFEKPRGRVVRIVRHNGKHQKRYVVKMDVCLGHSRQQVEVSLIDRSQFIYPLLLGRSALEQMSAIVDPTDTFMQRPACEPGIK